MSEHDTALPALARAVAERLEHLWDDGCGDTDDLTAWLLSDDGRQTLLEELSECDGPAILRAAAAALGVDGV